MQVIASKQFNLTKEEVNSILYRHFVSKGLIKESEVQKTSFDYHYKTINYEEAEMDGIKITVEAFEEEM